MSNVAIAAADAASVQPKPFRLEGLRRLWWETYLQFGDLPSRYEFGFAELQPWLGQVAVFDLSNDPWRISLWGTALVEMTGVDLTGKTFGDPATAAVAKEVTGAVFRAAKSGVPVGMCGDLSWCNRAWRRVDRLFLPTRDTAADGRATRIVGVSVVAS